MAQTIRDTWIHGGYTDMYTLKANQGYYGTVVSNPSQTCIDAVDFILNGGYAVKHRLYYFYAPDVIQSGWHETQNFVVHYKGHRFFDRW